MALQNHNLLIALGAARQAGAAGPQHFAMPVRIFHQNVWIANENTFAEKTQYCNWLLIDWLFSELDIHFCSLLCIRWWQAHFFDPHFLRTQQFGDTGSDTHGDDNSNNSSLNRRRDDDDDIDDDDDENDADSTNLPLNLVATQFAEWNQAKQRPWVQWMLYIDINWTVIWSNSSAPQPQQLISKVREKNHTQYTQSRAKIVHQNSLYQVVFI